MIIAPGLSFLSDSALMRCLVEALRGTWRDRMSLWRRRSSGESTNFAPAARAAGFGTLSYACTWIKSKERNAEVWVEGEREIEKKKKVVV